MNPWTILTSCLLKHCLHFVVNVQVLLLGERLFTDKSYYKFGANQFL